MCYFIENRSASEGFLTNVIVTQTLEIWPVRLLCNGVGAGHSTDLTVDRSRRMKAKQGNYEGHESSHTRKRVNLRKE